VAQTRHYSDFLNSLAALVGIPTSRITTELAAVFNTFFNTALQTIWRAGPWYEVCPKGEARFVGNRLTYPNNTTKTAYWTNTALTITANQVANPADGTTTASKMMETAANSAHKIVQSVTTFYPATDYSCSMYIRPNGRNDVQMSVSDGVTTHSAFFDMASGGSVGTTANCTATLAAQPNGFFLARITFTADDAATTSGTYSVLLSTDGSTTSYAGNTATGIYIWGNLISQTSNVPLNDSILPWDQTGENTIEAVFDACASSPYAVNNPQRLTYNITQEGIQLINANPVAYSYYVNGIAQQSIFGAVPVNPIFLYYRDTCPDWSGEVFDATATYAVDEQIYFVNSLGKGDYYKCLVATTAGQDPDNTSTSWEIITLDDVFYRYAIYQAYADWLISDGQMDKSVGAFGIAERLMHNEFDVRERQMGDVLPMKTQTHLTAKSNH